MVGVREGCRCGTSPGRKGGVDGKERGGQRGWVNGLALGGGIFVCVVFSL